ncbi:MAG: SMC family ATPase [Patescibacteria group bacterium]
MLPKKLHLHNFMSYNGAIPMLDFGQFDLACLSGPNGVGKSTLLEAITWALWGESRAKSDDNLIHQGSEGMIVSFEFELEGNEYKVVRKRSKKKKGQGQLEFYLFQNGDWQTQSGASKSETQEKINQILHLDYDTFINSAFLRQGHADEFTVKRPQERKTILAKILGLRRYDELQEITKEKIKIKEIEQESLKNIIARFEEEIKDKDKLEKIMEEKDKILKRAGKEVDRKEKEVEALRKEKAISENQKNAAENLVAKIKENKKDILFLEEEIRQKKNLLNNLKTIISKKEEIKRGYATWLELKQKDEDFYQKFLLQKKLLEEKNKLERGILMMQKEKEGEKKDLEAEVQKLREKWIEIDSVIKQIVAEKIKIDNNLRTILVSGAKCPLCLQDLGKEHKKKIKEKFEKEKKSKIEQEEKYNSKKQAIFSEANKIKKEIKVLEKQQQENNEKGTRAVEEVEFKLSQVYYNEKEHQEIKRQKLNYERYQILKIQLEEAEKQKELEVKTFGGRQNLLAKKKEILEKDLNMKEKITFDSKKFAKLEQDFLQESKKLNNLRQEQIEAKEEFAVARERMTQIDLKEKEIKTKKEKWEKTQKETAIFEELAESLGKKGVQAMIIESVLPEIEEEASALLDKMTEGRMAVKIFTQKEKKTDGAIQETLDIQIQDGKELQPYEMFSGGEAFRINFAIRIALSKLLARRAGAKLQFLVIDEGFGTQDILGREYIVEAINSIRPDFKKILAITHIQELKDAFPTRIEVTKDERGSHFEVAN